MSLVILEDAMLSSMARDAKIVKEFPIFGAIAKAIEPVQGKGCRTCGKKNANKAKAFQAVKTAIAQMDKAKIDRLKQFTGATQFKLYIRDPKTKSLGQKLL